MSAPRDLGVAYHEAGHAVLAAMLGLSLRRVMVHDPRLRSDEAGRTELRDHQGDLDADPTGFLLYLAAGPAADRKWSGPHSRGRDAGDLEQLRAICSVIVKQPIEHPDVDSMLAIEQTRADLVLAHPVTSSWVETVAKRLARRRALSAREVRDIGAAVIEQAHRGAA